MELYMPMNSVESPVNRLTSSHTDPVTHTPAFKEASVHLKVLPEIGESPLPRINSRFGHPTPQHGVEVERKWKRPDYASARQWTGADPNEGKERASWPNRLHWNSHPEIRAAELRSDLEHASTQHAEALLAAYEVLQDLHEQGVLEILRGAIGARTRSLRRWWTAVNTPEAIRAIRSLLYLGGTLGRIEPDWFQRNIPGNSRRYGPGDGRAKPASRVLAIVAPDSQQRQSRAVAAAVDLLEAFGRHLHSLEDERSKAGSQLQIGKEL